MDFLSFSYTKLQLSDFVIVAKIIYIFNCSSSVRWSLKHASNLTDLNMVILKLLFNDTQHKNENKLENNVW